MDQLNTELIGSLDISVSSCGTLRKMQAFNHERCMLCALVRVVEWRRKCILNFCLHHDEFCMHNNQSLLMLWGSSCTFLVYSPIALCYFCTFTCLFGVASFTRKCSGCYLLLFVVQNIFTYDDAFHSSGISLLRVYNLFL